MRINTLTIEHFKSIRHLAIELNGNNAVISGQNGAGKTTILDAVTWLLTNKMSDGKSGESSNLHDAEQVTAVEITLDNGLILRRECNGKSVYYINGVPCNATDFKISTGEIFKRAMPALLTPFNFCRMHYSERRNILLQLFAGKIEVDTADLTDIAEDIKTLSAEQVIKKVSAEKKQLDKELGSLPARIEELSSMPVPLKIKPAEIRTKIDDTQRKIDSKLVTVKELQAASKAKLEPYNRALKLEAESLRLADKVSELRVQYRSNELELEGLRKQYAEVAKATKGTCPTCGAKVPAANVEKIKADLARIIEQGKAISEQQEMLKKGAESTKAKSEELKQEAAALKQQYETDRANTSTIDDMQNAILERDELQNNLAVLKLQLEEIDRAAETQKRIEELKAREIELGAKISRCDKKIYQAETYIRRRIAALEQTINDHFNFATFKMFEDYKTVEGVKECCEPLLNGVPYAALSKGEQLKASLDILQALQRAYSVELPVFIDDAESYTSNSFVDLPNQIIRLVAAEGVKELQIQVDSAAERKSA